MDDALIGVLRAATDLLLVCMRPLQAREHAYAKGALDVCRAKMCAFKESERVDVPIIGCCNCCFGVGSTTMAHEVAGTTEPP